MLWSYAVDNSAATYNHGVPASISAGDVDGDGQPDIVFTVFFSYSNAGSQTTLHVLDGATGALKLKQNFPGSSMSSVALANLDNDPALEMVLSTSAGVYVVNGDGSVAPGWPQTPGDGAIDPVVADVDNDCNYEILVGKHLWRHNGLLYPGWPVLPLARSTGALVPLDSDANLEILHSAGNSVVYYRVEDTGTITYSKFNIDETLFVIYAGENGTQGVPIVGDADGDGIPDIIRPPELGRTGSGSCYARIYGGKAASAVSPANLPRWVTVGSDIIVRSSACLGDLDNDGQADLLIAAGGKIFAWNLGTAWNGNKDPWPMFQGNLANTVTLPRKKDCVDLYIPDTPVGAVVTPDTGLEPNATMVPQAFSNRRQRRCAEQPGHVPQ